MAGLKPRDASMVSIGNELQKESRLQAVKGCEAGTLHTLVLACMAGPSCKVSHVTCEAQQQRVSGNPAHPPGTQHRLSVTCPIMFCEFQALLLWQFTLHMLKLTRLHEVDILRQAWVCGTLSSEERCCLRDVRSSCNTSKTCHCIWRDG